MANTWTTIHTNFNSLMQTHVTASCSRSYSEYGDSVELSTRSQVPSSVWDGSYSIQMNGMPEPVEDINTVVDMVYNVRLQIAFELNSQDGGVSYQTACQDIEEIILTRLLASTFQDELVNVVHKNTSPLVFVTKTDSEMFAVVNIDFEVTGRRTH